MDDNTFLQAALAYARRDWSIIPIRHKPGTGGKQPALKAWKQYQVRRPTDAELCAMFNGQRLDGLAVILGDVSDGLVCRDFDVRAAYEKWADEHPDLAALLPTVETARGLHVYFLADVRRIIIYPDGELRGAGYCLLPPSRHPSGATYRWLVPLPDGPLPLVDPYACGLASLTEESSKEQKPEKRPLLYAAERSSVTLPPEVRATLPTQPGQRHHAIFNLVRLLKGTHPGAESEQFRSLFADWFERARPHVETQDFGLSWGEFCDGWRLCRYPRGELLRALAAAAGAGSDEERAIRVCAALQAYAGDAPFFLGCRTLGRVLGITHAKAAEVLRGLVAAGRLIIVERHTHSRATRYRYPGGD